MRTIYRAIRYWYSLEKEYNALKKINKQLKEKGYYYE